MKSNAPRLIAILAALLLGLAAAACSASITIGGDADHTRPALTSWTYDGVDHPVISGIAAEQPPVWVEKGWPADAIVIYLSDREITCADFPLGSEDRFPPIPHDEGAIVTLRFSADTPNEDAEYLTFDVLTATGENGVGTDSFTGGIDIVGSGEARRVEGWIEHDRPGDGRNTPPTSASGSFNIPFCA